MTSKSEIRQAVLARRNELSEATVSQKSEAICKQLIALCHEENIRSVHLYLAFRNEPDLTSLIHYLWAKGTAVICPKTLPNRSLSHLEFLPDSTPEIGMYGTRHPAGERVWSGALDLILIPGVAFDRQGNRLGYGAGYYDTFLAENPGARKVGVCFREQVVDQIPSEAHDIPVERLVTD